MNDLPDNLLSFLQATIPTFPAAELLVFLSDHPGPWQPDELADAAQPMSIAPEEVEEYLAAVRARPEAQLELGTDLVARCALGTAIDALIEDRPLALVECVLPALFTARSKRSLKVRRGGISRWKRGETDLGKMADSLLAFRAFSGGEPSEAAFAGALHIAEWLDSTRGLFRLFSAFMKALARRR